ncbi:MAG TPA: Mur ligase domain-containing protein [Actinotalea sp.]|nr:Mur ligase domain-containing protein [Actinotalea sp.]
MQGSDPKAGAVPRRLEARGATVHIGHRAGNVAGADVVVVSSAINRENPEVAQAQQVREAGRAEALPAGHRDEPAARAGVELTQPGGVGIHGVRDQGAGDRPGHRSAADQVAWGRVGSQQGRIGDDQVDRHRHHLGVRLARQALDQRVGHDLAATASVARGAGRRPGGGGGGVGGRSLGDGQQSRQVGHRARCRAERDRPIGRGA